MQVNQKLRAAAAAVLAVLLLPAPLVRMSGAEEAPAAEPSSAAGRARPFARYAAEHAGAAPGESELLLTAEHLAGSGETAEVGGRRAVVTREGGSAVFAFTVSRGGAYKLQVEYYPLEGKGGVIERSFLLDGKLPFEEARKAPFFRIWKDAEEYSNGFSTDQNGNELRPSQTESPRWTSACLRDSAGLVAEDLFFYLSAGSHTLTVVSDSEPMAIGALRMTPAAPVPDYEAYSAAHAGVPGAKGEKSILLEGENTLYKNQATIYPGYDRSSPLTSPFEPDRIRLNIIGGTNWQQAGERITWSLQVPETGLYTLALRARNSFVSGRPVARTLLIDGEVPFEEVRAVVFPYSSDWQVITPGGEEGAFRFYFEAGRSYELALEVTLGDFAEIIADVQESSLRLNEVYRQILVITGSNPDPNRDYFIDRALPGAIKALKSELARLGGCIREMERRAGVGGAYAASLKVMSLRVENMLKHPDQIPNMFIDFKNCIVSLGAWLISAREQPLELDWLAALPSGAVAPKAEAGIFGKLWMQIQLFYYSFMTDYNVIGDSGAPGEKVEVWTYAGRDQATVIRSLTADRFERESGTGVSLKQVLAGALMPAVLSGSGPDVFLSVLSTEPVNFAFRGAVRHLDGFSGIKEVQARFHESAMVPYTYDGKIYGLPETQTFPMMFYRRDILDELGLAAPETWDDVVDMLAELSSNNMQFGMPGAASAAAPGAQATTSALDLLVYWSLILQSGGGIYSKDGGRVLLDDEIGLRAFRFWTGFYTNYGLDYTFDFANRFRTGEMPIGISDFYMYSTLSVFAPEISGLWSFTSVPGTRRQDGTVDHSTAGGGTGTVMMRRAKNPERAWAFMEWWCRADTQAAYAREMESILGTAARYPVANLQALEKLPWSSGELEALKAQWASVKGIPEVPGSYIVNREVSFAFRNVLIEGADARESMLDQIGSINAEIKRKRKEYGIS